MTQQSSAQPLTALPEGWVVSTVQVTETAVYGVLVAHPPGAAPAEVATAGYQDYKDTLDPDQVFPVVVVADGISVADRDYDGETAPSWDTISHVDAADAVQRSAAATRAGAA